MSPLRILSSWLGSLKVTVLGLFLLLVLTVWGTVYQHDHGIYAAQERFYQSWSFPFAGFLHFPGAKTVMLMLFINLAASLLHMTLTRRLRVGFLLTHTGLALMLGAGGVTFYLGRSGQLELEEGAAANVAVSSGAWELALMPAGNGVKRSVAAIDVDRLHRGASITLPGTPFTLKVEEIYRNCTATRGSERETPVNGSGFTALSSAPTSDEPARNVPGILGRLYEGGQQRGRILLWGFDATPTVLPAAPNPVIIGLRFARLPLPDTLRLIDFKRELHPGTGMARSYSSEVEIGSDPTAARRITISMNKPLRLGSFTFYQSSFAEQPGGRETSTLAVVQNYGRLMPYVATGMVTAGMTLHFLGLLITRTRRKQKVPS